MWCACVSVGGELQRDLGASSRGGSVPEWLLDAQTGRFPQHLLCCQVCQSYFLDQSCSISFFFLKRVFCCSCILHHSKSVTFKSKFSIIGRILKSTSTIKHWIKKKRGFTVTCFMGLLFLRWVSLLSLCCASTKKQTTHAFHMQFLFQHAKPTLFKASGTSIQTDAASPNSFCPPCKLSGLTPAPIQKPCGCDGASLSLD